MNANELAQYLEEQMSGWATDLVLREAANMLRQFDLAESIIKQQQLEIEALKKKIISLEFLARKEK